MNFKTAIGRLRLAAILEGVSYLLLAVTMPIKYILEIPQPNYIVGMFHGILFITYLILCFQNILIYRWGFKTSFLILGASLVPAATFWADKNVFKKAQS